MRVISAPPPHLLSLAGLVPSDLEDLLETAVDLKADRDHERDALAGRTVLMHFTKPSTRTRLSFEAAIVRLGGHPVFASADQLQLGRGEPIRDTARVVSRYAAAIVIRTHAHRDVEEFAAWSTVPVINALTDTHHPCQALADLLTLRERFGALSGLTVAYVGDGNNVAHSLIEACALAGMHVRVACPEGYRPARDVVEPAAAVAQVTGGSVTVMDDPAEAVEGACAVYTDVFVSMGEEDVRERKLADLARYQVDEALMARALPDAVFLHCLPAHRGEEVTERVLEGTQSAVFDQAENRLHTAAAVLLRLTANR
jgi:ornithine carbamoyltransferase